LQRGQGGFRIAVEVAAIFLLIGAAEKLAHDVSAGSALCAAMTAETRHPDRCNAIRNPEFGAVQHLL
jgi:hypothetical protein